MKKVLLLFVLGGLFYHVSIAQQKQIKRPDGKTMYANAINAIVAKLMDTAQVEGLQLGIVNDNKPAYLHSYGYKNKALNQMNDTSTCFYAASLAKALFADMVMQLVDDKVIDLDKPVYQYLPKPLPQYENYKDLAGDERWKMITPRMCLSHTTGFPNWREFTESKKLTILFTPGSRYSYSGEGIMLLQFVVETVTGKTLDVMARERIFRPLGMTRSDYTWQPRFETDFAVGHDMNGDTLGVRRYDKPYAAGSMETTVADYTRFMAAVMQGKGLSVKASHDMLSPQIAITSKRQFLELDSTGAAENKAIGLSYGLGWGLFNTPYGKAFFKEGHLDGWVHYVIGFPDKKIALVILCNSTSGESIFKELVEKLTGVTIPWYWESYTSYRANVKLSAQQLQQYAGEYSGKIQAIITVVNGQLKVESPTVNLGKTNLYAQNDHHFFLKIMDTDIDFVKDASGKVIKAVLDDEGDHYELTKTK